MQNKKGKRKTKCFARFVVLETTIHSDVTMLIHRKNERPPSLLLKPTDVVVVRNIATLDRHSVAAPIPHFPAYGKLLTEGGCTCSAVVRLDKKCDQEEGTGQFRTDVEEVLLSFNVYAPNGDCGPTGP
jgi:hypothetical protein